MAKRNRRPNRVRTQKNRARTGRTGGPRQATGTPKNEQSAGAGKTNRGKEAQKPKAEWVAVEHRDPDGNPTLPKELIAGTYLRRYAEVPEGTKISVTVLAGYKPKPLMMVERKIYEIHRLSVRGWRRRGQIAVEMDGWRQHETDWFNAMRGVQLELSDPGLPGPHNEKAHYIISESSSNRKIVTSVSKNGDKTEVEMYEGTLDITERWLSAWRRQAAEVLNMGFKYLLLPLLSALVAGLAVWWIDRSPNSSSHDSAIPQSPTANQVQGGMSDSGNELSDTATNYQRTRIPPKPSAIDERDSTRSMPRNKFSTEESTGSGEEEIKQSPSAIPANSELEERTPEPRGPPSPKQEQVHDPS